MRALKILKKLNKLLNFGEVTMKQEENNFGLFAIFLLVMFLASMFFSEISKAEEETVLADAIEELCFNSDADLSNKEEQCMIYYVNCVIGKGGKWTDKKLFQCMREKDNGSNKSKK